MGEGPRGGVSAAAVGGDPIGDAEDQEEGEAPTGADLAQRVALLEARLAHVQEERRRFVAAAVRLVRVLLPFAYLGFVLLTVRLFHPELFRPALARMSSSLLLGKLSAVGGQGDFLFWLVVLSAIDIAVGLFLVWNLDLVHRVPGVGPLFRRFERASTAFLGDHGWVRRLAFVGIVLVVVVPFQGTGAIMASILGRLLGMGPWRTFTAIAIGAFIGVGLVLSGSLVAVSLGDVGLPYAVGFVGLLVVGLVLVWVRWFRVRRGPPVA